MVSGNRSVYSHRVIVDCVSSIVHGKQWFGCGNRSVYSHHAIVDCVNNIENGKLGFECHCLNETKQNV